MHSALFRHFSPFRLFQDPHVRIFPFLLLMCSQSFLISLHVQTRLFRLLLSYYILFVVLWTDILPPPFFPSVAAHTYLGAVPPCCSTNCDAMRESSFPPEHQMFGVSSVMVCGLALILLIICDNIRSHSSCVCPIRRALSDAPNVLFSLSTTELACGRYGLEWVFSAPHNLQSSLKTADSNWRPWSLCISSGVPK